MYTCTFDTQKQPHLGTISSTLTVPVDNEWSHRNQMDVQVLNKQKEPDTKAGVIPIDLTVIALNQMTLFTVQPGEKKSMNYKQMQQANATVNFAAYDLCTYFVRILQ